MSGMMMHGLGDCTPELNCGCIGKPPDMLRERIARALDGPVWTDWRMAMKTPPVSDEARRKRSLTRADAVIAALGLREVHDGEGHYWQTPWERIEEDQ